MSHLADPNSTPSLLSVVLNHAIHTPDNDFLIEDKGSSLSYNQSYVIATELIPARLQTSFPSLSTQSNTTVVLLSPNNTLFVLSVLALWNKSINVVPLSSKADPGLWGGMVNAIKPDLLLVAPNLMEPLRLSLEKASLDHKILDLTSLIPSEFLVNAPSRMSDFIPSCHSWLRHVYKDWETLQRAVIESPFPDVQRDKRAVTLFTSSAVDWATLKSVSYTHEMLVQSSTRAMLMLGGLSYSSTPKRHLGWLPLSHCFELCISFCGIVLGTGGAYIFFDNSLSSPSLPPSTSLPPLLTAGLAYHSPVTSFTTVPAIFAGIVVKCTNADLKQLRMLESLGVGGARTPESLFQWAAAQGIPYFDCSGATEAAGTICIRRALEPSQRYNGLQVIPTLMGTLEKANPSDNFGELIILGTHLPTGYDNLKSDAFRFDPVTGVTTYRTGDLYSHQEKSQVLSYLSGEQIPPYDSTQAPLSGLSHIGRTDDLVVFATGVKVDALSLENILDAHPNIVRSALLGNTTGETLVALIQPHSTATSPIEQSAIVDAVLSLNKSLPFEKRLNPGNIYIVHDLPVTTKLTLNRKKIRKAFSGMTSDSEIPILFPPPRSPPSSAFEGDNATMPSTRSQVRSTEIRRRVIELLGCVFNVPESHFDGSNRSFSDIPLTSLSSVKLAKALYDEFSVRITGAQIYGIHHIDDLCSILESQDVDSNYLEVPSERTPSLDEQNIVISGAACRFVGGIDSLDSLWAALISPDAFVKNLSRHRPSSRWETPHPHEDMMFPSGWLDDSAVENVASFAEFFRIPPREALSMSPNARLVLQLGYQAIEDAGIAPKTLRGRNWGVFTSVNDAGWRERRACTSELQDYASGIAGSADDAVGARLSYFLDLTGPALEIKTACSSSAVAVHQACSAIRNGDCEAAVVVAATTHYHPAGAIFRSRNGITSASGKCSPFSDSADGFVASEGAAAIVLQKSTSAKEMAYASIRSTSVTQDGASRGFFAPNPKAQTRLFKTALEKASSAPDDINFLEAHGTGTQLGDAIELQAISKIFGMNRTRPLYIGSAKAVVGHTEECAGITGLLKVLLCFSKNAIPPQPCMGPLNAAIDFAKCNSVIPAKVTAFLPQAQPRLCGVSSFGLSGTLAHIIVQEPAEEQPHFLETSCSVFLLSAHNPADYPKAVRRYLDFFNDQILRADMLEKACRTTQLGRDHFPIRRAWKVSTWRALLDALREALHHPIPRPFRLHHTPRLGIWFGMPLSGRSLGVNNHPLYHSKVAECLEAGWAPEYEYFMQQLAFARCLTALGYDISVVGGEGISEYVAATFVGLIPPSAVFRLVDETNDPTRSVTARCSRAVLEERSMAWRTDELRIIGEHGLDLFTLRGVPDALTAFASDAEIAIDRGNCLPPTTILTPVVLSRPPMIPIVSGHLGETLEDDMVVKFDYWCHVQDRDIHAPTAWEAMASQCDIVVDLGLVDDISHGLGDKCLARHGNSLENICSQLFEVGAVIDWDMFASKGPKSHLPPYTWATDSEYHDATRTPIRKGRVDGHYM